MQFDELLGRGFPFSGSFERHELWGLAVIIHR
jgi:hypothetical protein